MGQHKVCEVNINLPITLVFEENMPQKVLINVSLTINPPAPPALVATPPSATLPSETVGVAVTAVPVSVVSGGTPPFQQPVVDPSSPAPLPPGLTASIDGSGAVTLSGTPTVAGSGTFVLAVADSGA